MAQWRVPAWWPPWPQSQPTHFPGCLSAQGTTGKRSGGQGVGQAVKHGDISTTAMDISFSILFEFYFIFSLYFEALLYYLYRSFHAYVIRASKRQRHC